MWNNGKIDLDALFGIGLIAVIYIFGFVCGHSNGYRSGKADERQDCINAVCLNSSYFEDGTITNFYVNIDEGNGSKK